GRERRCAGEASPLRRDGRVASDRAHPARALRRGQAQSPAGPAQRLRAARRRRRGTGGWTARHVWCVSRTQIRPKTMTPPPPTRLILFAIGAAAATVASPAAAAGAKVFRLPAEPVDQ